MKTFIILLIFISSSYTFGSSPSWWYDHGIINVNNMPNNYGPANLGQAKNITVAAINAIEIKFYLNGGAGQTLLQYRNYLLLQTEDNYSPLNIGQLKNMSKLIYDRLIELGFNTRDHLLQNGYPTSWPSNENYPWLSNTPISENYRIANIGQLKMVYSFDLDFNSLVQNTLTSSPTGSIPSQTPEYYAPLSSSFEPEYYQNSIISYFNQFGQELYSLGDNFYYLPALGYLWSTPEEVFPFIFSFDLGTWIYCWPRDNSSTNWYWLYDWELGWFGYATDWNYYVSPTSVLWYVYNSSLLFYFKQSNNPRIYITFDEMMNNEANGAENGVVINIPDAGYYIASLPSYKLLEINE